MKITEKLAAEAGESAEGAAEGGGCAAELREQLWTEDGACARKRGKDHADLQGYVQISG